MVKADKNSDDNSDADYERYSSDPETLMKLVEKV